MPRTAAPLIARLRRRLVTSVWLFAFLVLAKSALAASCSADGLAAGSAAAAVAVSVGIQDDGIVNADDGAGAPCWHDGAAGCHCSCAHGAALPVDDGLVASTAVPSAPPRFARAPFVSSPRKTALRPPI